MHHLRKTATDPTGRVSWETRLVALNLMAAPLGRVYHNVNNGLAAIGTSTFALELEGIIPKEDAALMNEAVASAKAHCASFRPIALRTERPVAGACPVSEIPTTVGLLLGRRVTVMWASRLPDVADVALATRALVAALWSAAAELDDDRLLVTTEVVDGHVTLGASAPDGRSWGPVPVARASAS